jgi:HTH-type transcriptional regulator/antitoxin HigA
LDPVTYGKLLAHELPKPIESREELDRMIEKMEALDFADRQISPEEKALLEVYGALVEAYEEKAVPILAAEPHEMLQYLMEDRGLKQADLVPVLGSRTQASDSVTGRRGISKAQAKKLAEYFRVNVSVFL